MNNDIDELIQTLEDIREEKYPNIPEGLVREIVEVEFESLEERSEASGRVSEIVESYLGEEV